MSVESVAIALHHSMSAGTTKLVLVGIANHDGDGGAWPSIAKLARYAGKSERTVQRAINELAAIGEIVVHEQAGGDSTTRADRRTNLYEFVLSCPPDCDGSKEHRLPGDPGYGVTRMSPRGRRRGDARVAGGVTPVSPEPSLEPSTPLPPISWRAGCARHPDSRGRCCRSCGTTPRQLEAAARAAALEARRAADKAAAEEARARRSTAADPVAGAALARSAIAAARGGAIALTPDTTTQEVL